jgi:hypothetical protein
MLKKRIFIYVILIWAFVFTVGCLSQNSYNVQFLNDKLKEGDTVFDGSSSVRLDESSSTYAAGLVYYYRPVPTPSTHYKEILIPITLVNWQKPPKDFTNVLLGEVSSTGFSADGQSWKYSSFLVKDDKGKSYEISGIAVAYDKNNKWTGSVGLYYNIPQGSKIINFIVMFDSGYSATYVINEN